MSEPVDFEAAERSARHYEAETSPDYYDEHHLARAYLRLLPTGAAGEGGPSEQAVANAWAEAQHDLMDISDWSDLAPDEQTLVMRMVARFALPTPAREPVAWTEWLTTKREYARLQAAIWKDAPEEVQGNPVEMVGYWRGYDAALGDVLARKVNTHPPTPEAGTVTERDCTCLGSCKGASGLAKGWRCALAGRRGA